MTITVTFDSMDEFIRHLRPMEGFEEPQPKPAPEPELVYDPHPDLIAAAEEHIQQLQEEATAELTEDYRVEVRKALAKLNKQTGENTAKVLIGQVGYKKLSDVPLEKLPELMAKVEEAANG